MVGPTTPEERRAASRRFKLVFVLLVGLSGGLIALQSDGSFLVALLAMVAGLLVGVVMVVFAFPSGLRGG